MSSVDLLGRLSTREAIGSIEMNKTIWKYRLQVTDIQPVNMPEGAEILSVQFQGCLLCLWALVNAARPTTERVIEIFGTGNPVYCDMGIERKFIATAQQPDLPLVWHVFERLNLNA